ncbi:hypothetical protein BaRGS_00034161 [Batillaria attramentaria]|uniref:Uncharacterized protein n=1 Tax=Batillaria attramentaria TaxID=370345 RepID=A0ABD0JHU5_9CAEN
MLICTLTPSDSDLTPAHHTLDISSLSLRMISSGPAHDFKDKILTSDLARGQKGQRASITWSLCSKGDRA